VIGKETRSEFGPQELVYCSNAMIVCRTAWFGWTVMERRNMALYKKMVGGGPRALRFV
jgi:hypothetical protein